jgi:hypothetical protein
VVSRRTVLLFQLPRLHRDGDRAERTGLRRTVAARLLAGAAVLLGWTAAALLVLRPGRDAYGWVLAAGAAALAFAVAWAVLLWRNARWVRRGLVLDAAEKRPRVSGLDPVGDVPDWLWVTLRIGNLVGMCVPVGGLLLALAEQSLTTAEPQDVRWWFVGGPLVMTGLMGGIVGGLGIGLGANGEDCWTPRGAVGWLVVYGTPFLLSVPWLSGTHAMWSGVLLGLAVLWLLVAPVNKAAKDNPGTAAD